VYVEPETPEYVAPARLIDDTPTLSVTCAEYVTEACCDVEVTVTEVGKTDKLDIVGSASSVLVTRIETFAEELFPAASVTNSVYTSVVEP
jgi:hypothetical protein